MLQLTEDFHNKRGKVLIEHGLWGKQAFRCEALNMINDDTRIGVCIDGHDIFVFKNDIILCKLHERMLQIADRSLTITVIYE